MGIAAEMKDIAQDIANSYDLRMADVGRLKGEAVEMLAAFEASHKKMGVQLRQDLAQDKAKMRAEVKALWRELADDKVKMGAEVKAMRGGFQSSRKEMSSALKKDLADHNRTVKDEAAKMRQEIGASHQDRSAEVKAMLNDFRSSHKQMGAQLRKELADYDRGIESEVAGMRQETIVDLREARTAWQELASNMQAKRGGAEILPKAEAPVAKKEIPDLEAKLLAAVNEHANGITLAEVADSLGVAPIVLGRASRSLLEKGRIRKEERLYFPASAE